MIILASSSQRRIELLKDAGIKFEVIPSQVNEDMNKDLGPENNAMNVALLKAEDVFQRHPNDLVVAADTIVVYNGKIFGKPLTEDKAIEMLKTLAGKKHQVITGVAILYKDKKEVFYSKTNVILKELSEQEIIDYVATKEPLDKAGAYAIQGIGKSIVDTYEGDFFTIVGLPLKEVVDKIAKIQQ